MNGHLTAKPCSSFSNCGVSLVAQSIMASACALELIDERKRDSHRELAVGFPEF
jgi:hypothetical protein